MLRVRLLTIRLLAITLLGRATILHARLHLVALLTLWVVTLRWRRELLLLLHIGIVLLLFPIVGGIAAAVCRCWTLWRSVALLCFDVRTISDRMEGEVLTGCTVTINASALFLSRSYTRRTFCLS